MPDVRVALLVGGMGTRLRSVLPSTPKALATVGEKSFLELLVRQLAHQGFHQLVMCTGYLADQIETEFGDGSRLGARIEYSREQSPLGTAGAIKLAAPYLKAGSEFVVMNGDSFTEVDLGHLVEEHRRRGGIATVAVLPIADSRRYGTVELGPDGRVSAFLEKRPSGEPGLMNTGVYVFSPELFHHVPDGPASLERDVFPHILDRGVYGVQQQGIFIDIGVPDDFARARELSAQLYEAASKKGSPDRG